MAIQVVTELEENRNESQESKNCNSMATVVPIVTVTDFSDPTDACTTNEHYSHGPEQDDGILSSQPQVHLLVRCGAFKDRKRGRVRS